MDISLWLFKYAERVVKEHNFDSSHDMLHFMNTYTYAKKIVNEDFKSDETLIADISREDSLKIIYYSAFCHDLIDSKYVDSEKAISELRFIFSINNFTEYTDIVIFIITNMSFSKQRAGNQNIPEKYQLALDIVSDADKLDAYRVERVIAYQERKNSFKFSETENRDFIGEKTYKEESEKIINGWVKTILVKRVLEYRDKWLKTECSKRLAEPMHKEVEKYVEENLKDVEMFEY